MCEKDRKNEMAVAEETVLDEGQERFAEHHWIDGSGVENDSLYDRGRHLSKKRDDESVRLLLLVLLWFGVALIGRSLWWPLMVVGVIGVLVCLILVTRMNLAISHCEKERKRLRDCTCAENVLRKRLLDMDGDLPKHMSDETCSWRCVSCSGGFWHFALRIYGEDIVKFLGENADRLASSCAHFKFGHLLGPDSVDHEWHLVMTDGSYEIGVSKTWDVIASYGKKSHDWRIEVVG